MSSHLWYGDVLIHTDVARDLLVLEEMVQTKSPTLIGPRSGGVSGVFHGPLWYYVELLPFIISGGDPVMMGWFWWLLGVLATAVFFYLSFTSTKNLTVTLLSTIAFAFLFIPSAAGPINTYLADLLSFIVFFIWWKWFEKPSLVLALAGWFSLGVLVQFQMAFAVPLAIVWLPAFVWKVFREKRFLQLLSPMAFLPPLASFFIFDVRHDWLQTKSVLAYLGAERTGVDLWLKLVQRGQNFLFDSLRVFGVSRWLTPIIIGLFVFFGRKNKVVRPALFVLGYWYVSWWLITLLFSGEIWSYYFSQFFGPALFVMALIASKSKPATYLLGGLVVFSLISARSAFWYEPTRFNSSSWVLLSQMAAEGLKTPDTGYFVYSQDQFAYPLKYAFSYYAKTHPELAAVAFKKRPATVLVKAEDDARNPFSNSTDWQLNKVRITQTPVEVKQYPFGYTLERYQLNQENLQSPVDPNMITDLHFR